MKTITVEEIVESVVIERSSSLAYAQAYALCAIAIISYLNGYHEGEERSIHAVYKVYKAQVPWECS